MAGVGIICEYNPFHNGHLRQLRLARAAAGEEGGVVCLMSGNYVQRGAPAIFSKGLRAQAAVRCGADLVLELPITAALSSAEGFAAGGVSILTALGCDLLCFGTETADFHALTRTARANLNPAFDSLVREGMKTGCSYPAARQRALEALGAGAGLSAPNDILAVEYCKALLRQNSPMRPLPILRTGGYHARTLEPEAPSASALREAIVSARGGGKWPAFRGSGFPFTNRNEPCSFADKQCLSLQTTDDAMFPAWQSAVPNCLRNLYSAAPIHTWSAGERAVLARVRTLPDAAFEALPFGTEGLWSKLMKNCRRCNGVEEIVAATVSRRYTQTRIRRMLLSAVLGLTRTDLETAAPYVRILGFNRRGRVLLREMKRRFCLVNAGQKPENPAYYALESRAADLYSLFSAEGPRPAGEEDRLRVFYADTGDCGTI